MPVNAAPSAHQTASGAMPWTTSQALCAACGELFTGVTAFDLHQRQRGQHVDCLTPGDVGLVPRRLGWGKPGSYWSGDGTAATTATTTCGGMGMESLPPVALLTPP